MELVNNQYVRFDKFDIFLQQAKALEQEDRSKLVYFEKLFSALVEYEKEKKEDIAHIYVSKDSPCIQQFFRASEFPIKRQTLINALLLGALNGDIDIAQKLSLFLSKKEVLPNELEELLYYVLEHSIDINEYFDGEKQRIIYNDKENKFEKGYIYGNENLEKYRKVRV